MMLNSVMLKLWKTAAFLIVAILNSQINRSTPDTVTLDGRMLTSYTAGIVDTFEVNHTLGSRKDNFLTPQAQGSVVTGGFSPGGMVEVFLRTGIGIRGFFERTGYVSFLVSITLLVYAIT